MVSGNSVRGPGSPPHTTVVRAFLAAFSMPRRTAGSWAPLGPEAELAGDVNRTDRRNGLDPVVVPGCG
jgi:hypothetical protein